FDPEAARYLVEHYYDRTDRGFKGCHPRDIVDLIADICAYHGEPPAFTRRHLDAACQSYFVSMQEDSPTNVRRIGGLAA
ncbi:MAG: hypothetical protein HY874_00750, partial [Chloroflexi bacterium]|nr:hypothetical protein [Chloroflexota bacterium]